MVEPLSWLICAGSFLLPLYLIRINGFMAGARTGWIIVLLLAPSWMAIPFRSMHVDARSLCAFAIVIASVRRPYSEQGTGGWSFADLWIILLVAAITISQFAILSVSPMAPFDPLREFALPYLVGRLFVRTPRDIETILPTFCKCLTILAAYALIEALTSKNPMELALGRTWAEGEGSVGGGELDSYRWGLKRAFGTQTHPIYFGLTFAMMLPWAVEAAVQSFNRRGPGWWKLMPLITLAGVVSTGSRAAQICSLIVLVSIFFQATPRLRPFVLLLLASAGIGYVVFREDVVQWLQNYAEESKSDDYVKIKGELKEYSGTKHRDLLFEVYDEAIDNAGWLGYGALLINVPRDSDMDDRFRSIDNHYLLFYLQYGYLGLAVFILLAVTVLWNLVPAYFGSLGPPGRLVAGMLGAVGGCLIAMRSVWFAADYSCVWLFCAGLSVSLARWYREARAMRSYPLV